MLPDTEIKKNRKSLVLMFSIGLIPVIIAYIVFVYFPEYMPTSTTNQGELITPSVSNEQIELKIEGHQWTLLIPLAANCGEECEKRFYFARQVNVALGKEAERVKRIMLTLPESDPAQIRALEKAYPDMEKAEISRDKTSKVFANTISDLFEGDYVLLMDPNGNIMMYYTMDLLGQPMLKDIKFLLKISNIG